MIRKRIHNAKKQSKVLTLELTFCQTIFLLSILLSMNDSHDIVIRQFIDLILVRFDCLRVKDYVYVLNVLMQCGQLSNTFKLTFNFYFIMFRCHFILGE